MKPNAVGHEPDAVLIIRARDGDPEAFNELVVRHRMKAFTWANHISQDPHLAEDIVQDALLRAFLHLGTLMDCSRFVPWLKGIVRNQALMKMRRGGPYQHEQPLSSFRVPALEEQDVDVHNLDSILQHLTKTMKHEDRLQAGNPHIQVERREFVTMIQNLLHCLTNREREVFEAHFFRECTPQEIAVLFLSQQAMSIK